MRHRTRTGQTTDRLLALRLEPHADPQAIAGWLYDERGGEHYFAGWLRLLTLLEQARLKAASDSCIKANTKQEFTNQEEGK
jgi:hypothetical protein